MPSPIAHVAAGYAVYALSRRTSPGHPLKPIGPFPGRLAFTATLSLLPDVDSIAGLLSGNLGRFHNNLTHGLIFGLGVAVSVGLLMHWRSGAGFGFWTALAGLCYALHVIMDWATLGRGVMALWPLTEERYLAPVILFYGLHWSQGLTSGRHLVTLATELGFVGLLLLALLGVRRRPGRA